jgi:bifunctional non-homologous end joining protein LigD
MNKIELRLGSKTIEISNPEKVLYPDNGFSKADLVEYYRKIAGTMLPHIQGRPINMQRFPNGITAGGFYEKELPDYYPDWIGRTEVYVKGKQKHKARLFVMTAPLWFILLNRFV